jgi:diketogulonate reductase-like aldo/keto reductase
VSHAVRNGYKLVDCAYCYANEDEVGQGLKEAFDAGVKREDIFVTSKVWATYTTRVEEGLNKSLKALGLDYVDLFMIVSAFLPLDGRGKYVIWVLMKFWRDSTGHFC